MIVLNVLKEACLPNKVKKSLSPAKDIFSQAISDSAADRIKK